MRQSATTADNLLFGPPMSHHGLSALHPNPIQIFKLWQMYLDGISPLIKITHTPTLQGRIIEAASNLKLVSTDLEALMFAIYCVTVMTLTDEDCHAIFSSTRDFVAQRFRTGCQQALWQCQFLRTESRDCLTAFSLYLVGLRRVQGFYADIKHRYRSGLALSLSPSLPCLVLRFGLRSGWASTVSQYSRSAARWKRRCGEDSGGFLF